MHKSNKNLFAQFINDEKNIVITGASTMKMKEKNREEALGKKIAALAEKNNIKKVLFDRGRFKYHGIIAKFAEAVRCCGLEL